MAASKEFVAIQELLYSDEGVDGLMRVAAVKYEFAFAPKVGNIGWDSKSKGKHMLTVEDVVFWLGKLDVGRGYLSLELKNLGLLRSTAHEL